jgi:hypothetical protein
MTGTIASIGRIMILLIMLSISVIRMIAVSLKLTTMVTVKGIRNSLVSKEIMLCIIIFRIATSIELAAIAMMTTKAAVNTITLLFIMGTTAATAKRNIIAAAAAM